MESHETDYLYVKKDIIYTKQQATEWEKILTALHIWQMVSIL